MKQGPRCARFVSPDLEPNILPSRPPTQSLNTQYFAGFVHRTFITHDVIKHEKRKVLFFFE